jgi:hypothetical protein
MRESITRFIREITDISLGLKSTYDNTVAYWNPDEPPTTAALSDLGHKIVDDLNLQELSANEAVFLAIEDAMNSDDEDLSTAVATGMIEGIISRASRTGVWEKIRPILGPASAHYADAWISS